MDVDLSGLDHRNFEHLVQSLALVAVGPHTTPFGDGRDGGREATFEGATAFPDVDQPWSGYGVIQAKCKSSASGSLTSWALRQLKSETAKFESRARRPQHYIYAVNVSLSAVEATGGLDTCHTHLQELVQAGHLDSFDVWDANKISRLLDVHEAVRRRYSAWICPSDLINLVCDSIEAVAPNFESMARNYLQKEMYRRQYAKLEQAGMSPDQRILINNVFVDIDCESGSRRAEHRHPGRRGNGFVDLVINLSNEMRPQGKIQTLLAVAGPGQGKSTVSQFLAQVFRSSVLRRELNTNVDHVTSKILQEVDDVLVGQGITQPTAARYPFHVDLPSYAASLVEYGSSHSIVAHIASMVRMATGDAVDIGSLRSWLREFPIFIVLDGLDEVPASANRKDVLEGIVDLRIDLASSHSDAIVLVTTRPQGYGGDLENLDPQVWTLSTLDHEQALAYGQRLVAARFTADEERQESLVGRIRSCLSEVATAHLMSTPLQVTIMVTLLERVGSPPRQRYDLFAEYYRVVVNRELERDIPLSRVIAEHRGHIDFLHRRVGLDLQLRASTDGADARLSGVELSKIVNDRLVSEGFAGEELERIAQDIVVAAEQRLVFLVGLEHDRVGFEIRSLQEFMAADAVLSLDKEDVLDAFGLVAGFEAWRNVALFVASGIFSKQETMRDGLVTTCQLLDSSSEDLVAASSSAGTRLAADMLIETTVASPRYEKLLLTVILDGRFDGVEFYVPGLLAGVSESSRAWLVERAREIVRITGEWSSGEAIFVACLASHDQILRQALFSPIRHAEIASNLHTYAFILSQQSDYWDLLEDLLRLHGPVMIPIGHMWGNDVDIELYGRNRPLMSALSLDESHYSYDRRLRVVLDPTSTGNSQSRVGDGIVVFGLMEKFRLVTEDDSKLEALVGALRTEPPTAWAKLLSLFDDWKLNQGLSPTQVDVLRSLSSSELDLVAMRFPWPLQLLHKIGEAFGWDVAMEQASASSLTDWPAVEQQWLESGADLVSAVAEMPERLLPTGDSFTLPFGISVFRPRPVGKTHPGIADTWTSISDIRVRAWLRGMLRRAECSEVISVSAAELAEESLVRGEWASIRRYLELASEWGVTNPWGPLEQFEWADFGGAQPGWSVQFVGLFDGDSVVEWAPGVVRTYLTFGAVRELQRQGYTSAILRQSDPVAAAIVAFFEEHDSPPSDSWEVPVLMEAMVNGAVSLSTLTSILGSQTGLDLCQSLSRSLIAGLLEEGKSEPSLRILSTQVLEQEGVKVDDLRRLF